MVKDRVNDDTELSDTELIIDPTVEENPSLTVEFTLKVCFCFTFVCVTLTFIVSLWGSNLLSSFWNQAICDTLRKLCSGDQEKFKKMLRKYYPSFSAAENPDLLDLADRLLDLGLAPSLQITMTLLKKMGLSGAVNQLQALCIKSKSRRGLF